MGLLQMLVALNSVEIGSVILQIKPAIQCLDMDLDAWLSTLILKFLFELFLRAKWHSCLNESYVLCLLLCERWNLSNFKFSDFS